MIEVKGSKKKPWRLFAGAAIVISVAAIAGQSVLASLNAIAFNTTPQSVDAGTLKLKLTDNGVGFTQSISNMAPGDVVNRYVTLENNGSLDGQTLALKTEQIGAGTLITDGTTTRALQLTVSSCSVPWNPASGECKNGTVTGTVSSELNATTIGSLSNFTNLVSSSSVNSGSFKYLKMSLQLPDQSETSSNGNITEPSVQGKQVTITYTFNLAQRTAKTTNS